MGVFGQAWTWFTASANWHGEDGVPHRLLQHLGYTALTVVIAVVVAVPLGLWIGHTGRLRGSAIAVTGALRALPTLGLLTLVVLWRGIGLTPPITALVVLAIPPLLAGAYAGVESVDRRTVDAARGMGMTEWQVVGKIEFPCALPLIMSGIRSATLQVIATLTVAAYVPFVGGLGVYVRNGTQSLYDPVYGYTGMVAGGIAVALLAVVSDAVLSLVQRLAVSPGLSGRYATRQARPEGTTNLTAEAQLADA
jgi:osmoprotectant transport system permease protein